MRRVILFVSVTLLVFGLIAPSTLMADDGDEAGTSLQNGATESSSQDQTSLGSSEPEGLLYEIIDALLGLVGANSDDPEGPLLNVHPQDYNPPTAESDEIAGAHPTE